MRPGSARNSRWSGRDRPLLAHPPLRTVRESFPSYGSSLSKPAFANRLHHLETIDVNLVMTVRMHHDQVGVDVRPAVYPPDQMMDMPSAGFGDGLTANRAPAALFHPKPNERSEEHTSALQSLMR